MIPELGHYALILALCVALIQGVLPLLGAHYGRREFLVLARPAAQTAFLLLAIAFGILAWSFYVNDFSVLYVAEHSNSQLPVIYRLGAVWGGHEGSLLLWIFLLGTWTILVAQLSKVLDEFMVARVIGVLGLVSSGLLLFVLTASNPFERLLPAAQDGRSLNPLLQDPGLVFHPPMLYMGYVGFSVAFAFAIASLLSGRLDAAWARWSRPWTTAAWVFLTLGIALGSWWAYYELGWGGWWFWDPVENASFIPWLVGTALLHSLAVTEKRGGFKSWTVLLAITAFSWMDTARLVRGQTLSLRKMEFVEAARAMGVSTPRIVFEHIVPNLLGLVLVYATVTVPSVILTESVLSFLGLGVPPPAPTWGGLLSGSGRTYMFQGPWLALAPACRETGIRLSCGRLRPLPAIEVLQADHQTGYAGRQAFANRDEAQLMPQMQILAFENLRDVLRWMRTGAKPEAQELDLQDLTSEPALDFSDVAGQSKARFAAEVAAIGSLFAV